MNLKWRNFLYDAGGKRNNFFADGRGIYVLREEANCCFFEKKFNIEGFKNRELWRNEGNITINRETRRQIYLKVFWGKT